METKLRIAGIMKNSVVDGPGIRYVVFTQGCWHKCEGCHNPETHDPTKGSFKDIGEIYDEFVNDSSYDGITLSGGEPFLQSEALAELCIRIHKLERDDIDIICYTGYTYEEILEISEKSMSYLTLLRNIDYLIDGKFVKDKASMDINWRGSTNQRIIDVKKSLETGTVVEADI